jgi:hypothetical protein
MLMLTLTTKTLKLVGKKDLEPQIQDLKKKKNPPNLIYTIYVTMVKSLRICALVSLY